MDHNKQQRQQALVCFCFVLMKLINFTTISKRNQARQMKVSSKMSTKILMYSDQKCLLKVAMLEKEL